MSLLIGKSVILTRVVRCISYFSPITIALYAVIAAIIVFYQKKRARLVKLIEKIPGPPSLPIIGNTIEINVDHDDLFGRLTGAESLFNPKKGIIRGWLGPKPFILIYHHKLAEVNECNGKRKETWDPVIDTIVVDSCLELFSRIMGMRTLWGRRQGFCRVWNGTTPYVLISKPSAVEPILGSPKHIEKSSDYLFLHPWLGTGLLTSSGGKWHSRRKILTPAFHFKILDDFIDVFTEQSQVLVQKMEQESGKAAFNIFPYVTLCTLDIVCETAMGRHVNAQSDSDSDYVKAIYEIGSIVQERQSKIWLQSDFIFKQTKLHEEHKRCIEVLHGFSYKVIRERKEEIRMVKEKALMMTQNNNNNDEYENNNNYNNNNNNNNNNEDAYPVPTTRRDSDNGNSSGDERLEFITRQINARRNSEEVIGKKKRLAFLDLLIEASKDGQVLSTDDIREEVDTFMFEGHDTTSAAISWTLFLIGSDPVIQQKVIDELDAIMDGDRTRSPTMKELLDMRYLECCIKEALRLYPSVPLIARHIREEVTIENYTIPVGTTAMIVTYMLHRNPEIYPKPEQFNPDRFLPENCRGRHPYAYIPFSAGPRNCIGQKFAILEEKAVISTVLRRFQIESMDRREDLTLLGELILRPKDGLRVRITPRE